MALKPGDKAPEFTLYSSEKQAISLNDYKGKNLVILFFPAAFTGVCTKELCGVRDSLSSYNSLNTDIVAISVDMVYSLAKYKEEQSYNFPLLSDFNKETSTAYFSIYDTWNFNMTGVSKRSAFVVDKDGIIQYAEVLENVMEIPNFDAINEVLNKLN